MCDKLSIREWQNQYRSGGFDGDDYDIAEKAGWEGWLDHTDPALQKLSKLVMGVRTPFLLDNFFVQFDYLTPGIGPMYGVVHFYALDEEKDGQHFLVALDSPHERTKWALLSERNNNGAPEFECENIRQMIKYINKIGAELESGIKPCFIAEREAIAVYALCQGEPVSIYIYQDGEHRYSYTSHRDWQKRTVIVASSLEAAPPDFDAGHAEEIYGLYVYCPEDDLKDLAGASWRLPEEDLNVDLQSNQPQRGVDLLTFLACAVRKNTRNYQSDYRFDAKTLCAAVQEPREGDRTFCWMSRPCGTWCLKEEEVFQIGSEAHTAWLYYESIADHVCAYRLVVTGAANGKPTGDVYPLCYKEHVQRVKQVAIPAAAILYTFQSGETRELACDDSLSLSFRRMTKQLGIPKKRRYIPENEVELSNILQEEHQAEAD